MQTHRSQQGAVLFTALIFLIVTTVIALASIRSGVLELRMSLNDEVRIDAFEQAQSLTDWVAATPSSTPVVGDEDFKRCTTENTDADCDLKEAFVTDATLAARIASVAADGGEYSVSVQRTGSAEAGLSWWTIRGTTVSSILTMATRSHSKAGSTWSRHARAS